MKLNYGNKLISFHLELRWKLDNLLTNQLMVSQVTDWSTCGLVNWLKYFMENLEYIIALKAQIPLGQSCHITTSHIMTCM